MKRRFWDIGCFPEGKRWVLWFPWLSAWNHFPSHGVERVTQVQLWRLVWWRIQIGNWGRWDSWNLQGRVWERGELHGETIPETNFSICLDIKLCVCFVGLLKARQRAESGTVPRAHVGQDAFGALPAGLENLAEGPAFVLALRAVTSLPP